MDRQELNTKLAEWVGFVRVNGILKIEEGVFATWYWEKEGEKYLPEELNFTQSLDACFKWLVPKLQDYTLAKRHNGGHNVAVRISGRWSGIEHNDNPAPALCLAIERIIGLTSLSNGVKIELWR